MRHYLQGAPVPARRLVSRATACIGLTALAVLCAAGAPAASTPPRRPNPVPIVFPDGTVVPVRFLRTIAGGRDSVGSPVMVQTLAALVTDSCVVVEPFRRLLGHVSISRPARRFGRPGELAFRFDSLEIGPNEWAPVEAVLDSVEYAERDLSQSGELAGGPRPTRGRYLRTGALVGVSALAEEAAVPVALLAGWRLISRGPKATVLFGEVARVRLTRPLTAERPSACIAPQRHPALVAAPELPGIAPRTRDDREGRRQGDPINVVLLGTETEIDSAFAHVGWVAAERSSIRSLARGVTAAIVERSAIGAPLSTQYFEGRKQDLAYELAGPNARFRHHLRIWRLDGEPDAWVAAADQDIGLVVKPFRRTATHRIAPDVDTERDLLVQELEAVGCADLLEYVELPGAARSGRNASGQGFRTDGRTAVVRLKQCIERRQ